MHGDDITSGILFKDVPDFPGYRVGDDGSVWTCRKSGAGSGSFGKWRPMRLSARSESGRLLVKLCNHNGCKTFQVHRLVLLVFVGPAPAGMLGLHGDGNHLNNRQDNLRYGTYQDNEDDKKRHGRQVRGDRHRGAKLTVKKVQTVRVMLQEGLSLAEIARKLDVSKKTIVNIKKGRAWKWVK